ncbi:MAG: hypothetical protein OEM52_13330 [bacterium]|nr:hypothetical protein [bacterium]
MGIVAPKIQFGTRKETIGLTPIIGSLSTRPLELDFSQLLQAVKIRSNSGNKSSSKATPLPVMNPTKLGRDNLSAKQIAPKSTVTNTTNPLPANQTANPVKPKQANSSGKTVDQNIISTTVSNPLSVISANRSVAQNFQDVTKAVKDSSVSTPTPPIALQKPTEISATPLFISDPLQLLVPTKQERNIESKSSLTRTDTLDTKQVSPLSTSDKKENQTTQKTASPTLSPSTATPTDPSDPVKIKTPTIANRKPQDQSNTTDPKSVETKKNETSQFVAPLDTKPVTLNQPTANLEQAKHISAPTLPALVEKLGTEIKQRLRDGERTLELFVTAPLIGKIFIELSEKDGQWVAAFSADNAAMQDLLHRHRDQLSQSLTSTSGIPAEVIVANTNDNASFREQFTQSNDNTGTNARQALTSREESPREYFSRTSIRSRSLTATREWIA